MFKKRKKQQNEIVIEDLKKVLDDINQQLLESNKQMLDEYEQTQK